MSALRSFDLQDLFDDIGQAGIQVTSLGAAEGSAGNISVFVRQLGKLQNRYLKVKTIDLPVEVPALNGGWLIATGTGKRLRDVQGSPEKNLCLLSIQNSGKQADLYSSLQVYPTSEINSHLAIHNDQVATLGLDYHAVVHSQPLYVTFLSHIPRYCDTTETNHRLMRWEPETLLLFPEGIGMLPYQAPGSAEMMAVTVWGLHSHKVVIWQRHGVVARSDLSASKAADYTEYLETAAHYEYLNLQLGEPAQGLSEAELREIARRMKLNQKLF